MIVLRRCRLIDGSGQDPVDDVDIVVDEDRIRRIGRSPLPVPREATVLDLDGLTVMPGLIDLHTHMGLVALDEPVEPAMLAAKIFENAALCLASGHTTAREVAGADGGLRSVIDAGLISGPRLFPSGPLLCQTGGHGHGGPRFLPTHHHGVPGLSQMSIVCDGAHAVRMAAREAFRRGATQIKVAMTGPILSPDVPLEWTQFTIEELEAAVEEAHAHGTYVTGHAHTAQSIRHGLNAGLECFEHGTFLDAETAAAMASSGAALIPTLTILHVTAERWRHQSLPEEEILRVERAKHAMANSMKLAREAGVRIGSGTDLFGSSQNRRGCEVMLKAGILGPMEAIVSATQTNARILRLDNDLGTVSEGKLADIIALDGDPLDDPAMFDDPDRVVLVIKGGRIMKDRREARVSR
jgi:imidazolonepropionase-like amidohydrolase